MYKNTVRRYKTEHWQITVLCATVLCMCDGQAPYEAGAHEKA